MNDELLHIYRNTPFGRETLMQSAYFARRAGFDLVVYRPVVPQFLMYFPRGIATVDLDRAFLRDGESAESRIESILRDIGTGYRLLEIEEYTNRVLPEVPVDFGAMTCPRTISNLSTKVGLGYIGPRVRNIIIQATFPVFIPPPVRKDWQDIACFFGGSKNAVAALRCALDLKQRSDARLRVFTQDEGKGREHYRRRMEEAGVFAPVESGDVEWVYFDEGDLAHNLFEVRHDDLVVAGAYGQGLARELLFGNKAEVIQTVLPNPLLIVGPGYARPPVG